MQLSGWESIPHSLAAAALSNQSSFTFTCFVPSFLVLKKKKLRPTVLSLVSELFCFKACTHGAFIQVEMIICCLTYMMTKNIG